MHMTVLGIAAALATSSHASTASHLALPTQTSAFTLTVGIEACADRNWNASRLSRSSAFQTLTVARSSPDNLEYVAVDTATNIHSYATSVVRHETTTTSTLDCVRTITTSASITDSIAWPTTLAGSPTMTTLSTATTRSTLAHRESSVLSSQVASPIISELEPGRSITTAHAPNPTVPTDAPQMTTVTLTTNVGNTYTISTNSFDLVQSTSTENSLATPPPTIINLMLTITVTAPTLTQANLMCACPHIISGCITAAVPTDTGSSSNPSGVLNNVNKMELNILDHIEAFGHALHILLDAVKIYCDVRQLIRLAEIAGILRPNNDRQARV
ncbi:hypothetical protein BAUCODRAFT_254997 [Baudoinia panamericana UAMH 10762]|uniref:Uncharacterized protein n=1 Tax=Baudoinia panamericana (strain UAMH 10762) TaxID=717646 RepID=M2M8A8_BAUPA|nr:uncharacterized protein BAUCODRAFT_254997 [Baudoinia panamericana UAMH 10762]EMC92596.1 hypothetical protein BAUCODRAFT_254997 [Baudoinia panamericana UAMH 10762]